MTRRKFIQRIAGAGLAMSAGFWWLVKKVTPRKFVRAVRLNYPGSIMSIPDVFKQSKWRG